MTTYLTQACPVCGSPSNFQLDYDDLRKWRGGALIQNVWPDMSLDDRETMVSGTHPDCWNELFG